MFSNTGQIFGLSGIVLNALGMEPDTVGGFKPGSIRGKYDGIRDIFNKQKKQREPKPQNQNTKKPNNQQTNKTNN